MKTIGAAVINDQGKLLPYTVESCKSMCEEKANEIFANWTRMKELGARIVTVEIKVIEKYLENEKWLCKYYAHNGHNKLKGSFEGGTNIAESLRNILQKRIRNYNNWFATNVTVITPYDIKCEFLIVEETNDPFFNIKIVTVP